MADWSNLEALASNRPPTLWWRDDDAIAATPALDRLLDLCDSVGAPLTLAVIPADATEALAEAIKGRNVTVAVHGWSHTNHAPPAEKKAEFGAHRPLPELAQDAARGKARLEALCGAQALPLFIPPWNRVADDLPVALAAEGFTALSAYAQREITATPLTRIDAHIDPIDWRGTRSAVSEQSLVDHVAGLLTSDAPIGLMTHHLVHDDAIWAMTETLVKRLTHAGAQWISARQLMTRA